MLKNIIPTELSEPQLLRWYRCFYVNYDGNADNKYVIGRNSYGLSSPILGNDYVSYYIGDTGCAYTDVLVYTHSYGHRFSLRIWMAVMMHVLSKIADLYRMIVIGMDIGLLQIPTG